MGNRGWAVLLWLWLLPLRGEATASSDSEAAAPVATRAWSSLTRLEVTTLTFQPHAGVGTGGTLLFPTSQGTLRPGAFASVGLGVDHAR